MERLIKVARKETFDCNGFDQSNIVQTSWSHRKTLLSPTGYRESSFLYALTAAGVAHAIARACAQGRLLSCGCDPLGYRMSHDPRRTRPNKWEWSGCSHNLAYGVEYSKKFLDAREKVDDLQSKINVHNNNAGRSVSTYLLTINTESSFEELEF